MSIKSPKNGFVILYAVIITTVVLVVGVSLMNIIAKQLVLSSISRNSKLAYYAALSGKECAEYWKSAQRHTYNSLPLVYFGVMDESSLIEPNQDIIYCNGKEIIFTTDATSNAWREIISPGFGINIRKSHFYLSFDSSDDKELCAKVQVTVNANGCGGVGEILIQSDGYNASCEDVKNEVGNPRRVKSIYKDKVSCP